MATAIRPEPPSPARRREIVERYPQGSKTSKPPRPELRPAPVHLPREREAAPPPAPAPRPAPALDPETKHARVAEALGVATALIAERDLAAEVGSVGGERCT